MVIKILVPLDGSELAAKILPRVEGLAKTYQAQVTLITIGHFSGFVGVLDSTSEVINETATYEKKTSERYLKKTANALQESDLKVDWVYEEAVPAEAIVAYADRQDMDLIAIATNGKGGASWALGSVAEKVASLATVPVLLFGVMDFRVTPIKKDYFIGI
jgi:nucleotide-binding universal stress UspA family protein